MRLVALTGYGRDDDVQRARDAGFDEHLLKPATLEQLASRHRRGGAPSRDGVLREQKRGGVP